MRESTTWKVTARRGTRFNLPMILTALAAALIAGCGGGSEPDTTGDIGREIERHFRGAAGIGLRPPTQLAKYLDENPPPVAPGSFFDEDLPHHGVKKDHNGSVTFASKKTKSPVDGSGQYAWAMYQLSSPGGPDDLPGEGNDVSLQFSVSPLYDENGNAGENPLYSGIANWETDEWDWQEHEYSRDGPTTLSRSLRTGHNTTRSNKTVCVVVVGPDEDDDGDVPGEHPSGGPGRFIQHGSSNGGLWKTTDGGLRLYEVGLTSGWKPSTPDEGWKSTDAPSGQKELDGDSIGDGVEHLAYFVGGPGARYARGIDDDCDAVAIPDTGGFDPDLSLALSSRGFPKVPMSDGYSHRGAIRWMSPEGLWNGEEYYDGGATPGGFLTDMCVLDDGTEVIAINDYNDDTVLLTRKRPGRVKYSDVTLKRGFSSSGAPVCIVDEGGEWVACRTPGPDGGIYLFRRTGDTWSERRIADAPCPVDPDGSPRGVLVGDLDRDGRLDLVCNTPEGDLVVTYDTTDGSVRSSLLNSADESGSCLSVQSCTDHLHVFSYSPQDGTLRYYQKRKFNEELLEQRTVARIAVGEEGVEMNVKGIHGVVGNGGDNDCDDDPWSLRVYLLRETTLTVERAQVKHWKLEVRVNRIEAA